MHYLRLKVRNKARVEGSIVEACIVQEITNCVSLYFRDHVALYGRRILDIIMEEHTCRMMVAP